MKGRGRIAVFFWEGYIGVSPSLINGIRLLSEAGYDVDLITRDFGGYADGPQFAANVRVVRLPRLIVRGEGGFSRRLRQIVNAIEPLFFVVASAFRLGEPSYKCFIGVDANGLMAARLNSVLRRVPVVYWSLEIYFSREYTRLRDCAKRMYKRVEKLCHRSAAFTIIQDEDRARAIAEENGVPSARFVIVPNSPLGAAPGIEGHYFETKFGVRDSVIILHAGMIQPETLSLEMAEAAAHWPDGWLLVLHDREKRSPDDPYLREVKAKGGDHVLLSLDPVPFDELDMLMASGKIGIVAYDPALGPNFMLVAGASGKAAYYLRNGLPVVAVGIPSLTGVLRKYDCGVGVDSPEGIEGAVGEILSRYPSFSANAVACYATAYEFAHRFEAVVYEIGKLAAAA